MANIRIEHFSDILCVWAWISQVRVDELKANFADDIEFRFHFFHIFGDVPAKLARQWADRGGAGGYAAHAHEVAARFDHVRMHPDAWRTVVPVSSMPAHLFLRAVGGVVDAAPDGAGQEQLRAATWATRRAFFEEARDISSHEVLMSVAESQSIDRGEIENGLRSGAAHAALAADLERVAELGVRSSPTMDFNDGRQRLTGNVGYRILEANIQELLRTPAGQQSWC